MRTNLKVFRVKQKLSQEEIAKKCGCKRATYSAIECGTRSGKGTFWSNFQTAFNVPDAEMWELMKDDKA